MQGSRFTQGSTRSERGDDEGRTLVIDEGAPGDEQLGDVQRSGALRPRLPRLRIALPEHDLAGARLAGAVLTALFLLVAALSVMRLPDLREALGDPAASTSRAAERVVYLTPEVLENPEGPAIDASERSETSPRSTAAAAAVRAGMPGALSPVRDTVQGGSEAASTRTPTEGLLRPIVPTGAIPSAGRLGRAAAGAASGARTGCAAPCREAAAAGIAPGTELARRDSMLRAKMAEVVERAGPVQSPPGFQVGLPGGGPTREERQRDSTLHAEYRARLRTFMQRYDSARADSMARGLIQPEW